VPEKSIGRVIAKALGTIGKVVLDILIQSIVFKNSKLFLKDI
jgi:hypothetical protein